MKLGEIMYKQNSQDSQNPQPNDQQKTETEGSTKDKDKNAADDDNVVDADFEEVEEDSEKKSS